MEARWPPLLFREEPAIANVSSASDDDEEFAQSPCCQVRDHRRRLMHFELHDEHSTEYVTQLTHFVLIISPLLLFVKGETGE